MPTNRATDGITLNKITVTITGAAITIAMGLGSYEYTQQIKHQEKNFDRLDRSQISAHKDVAELITGIHELVVHQKVNYAQQTNMDARIVENRKELRALRRDVNKWARELGAYNR